MARRGKRIIEARKGIDPTVRHDLDAAIDIVKAKAKAKFDESVDLAVNLGVDPRKADQMVRGACVLPHGTGKVLRVLVFAKGDKEQEARDAGADYVGGEEYADKIQKEGWLDFDKVVATPDMMRVVGRLGRILGPRGMMPNPKVGTVTFDVGKAVGEMKAGRIEFRVEKSGIVHALVGKASFEAVQLRENIMALMAQLIRMRPATAKGTYVKNMALSSTMGPGVRVDALAVQATLRG